MAACAFMFFGADHDFDVGDLIVFTSGQNKHRLHKIRVTVIVDITNAWMMVPTPCL
jgi:hypothetical protein